MDMDLLQKHSIDLYWDDETTQSTYLFPLSHSEILMSESSKLVAALPPNRVYTLGPYSMADSPESHIGSFKHALDFLVPVATPVYAVADGVIMEIKEHCERWGDGPEFRDYLNYLTVKHGNGEFSQYCHLQKNSVSTRKLKVGDHVRVGQEITETGMSGWMDGPHLHFIVYRHDINPQNPFGFKSLKVCFK